MTVCSDELIKKIRSIKGLEGEAEPFLISIMNSEGAQVGNLRPIDKSLAKLPEIAEKLTRWRRLFRQYFLTQFSASVERTGAWLERVVIPDDERILFLICDVHDKLIGNFGVCNLKPHAAELDNLIRGESGGDSKLILFAEIAMLSWLYYGVGVNSVVLHVFSNNARTISLHSGVGFTERQRFGLNRIQDGENLRYIVNSTPKQLPSNTAFISELPCRIKERITPTGGEPVDFDYIEMTMDRQKFELTNPWAKLIYATQWT